MLDQQHDAQPTIEIGSRATRPVALNRAVPGRFEDPAVGVEHRECPAFEGSGVGVLSVLPTMAPCLILCRADPVPYDAVLLVSFGGPEGPDDVLPFLENVTRGRGIPRERLEEVGEHYHLFGGRSPINDLNRDFLAAVRADLAEAGLDLPVYWGNRNWDPYLRDAVEQMAADGVTRAACFVTSAYSSWSSCRQYRENLYAAPDGVPERAAAGPAAALLQPPGLRGARGRRDGRQLAGRPARRACATTLGWSS